MSLDRFVAASLLLSLASARSTPAQGIGNYLNFESPQVKPVALAIVGTTSDRSSGDPYVLVCNTPNNRVEVYDISSADNPALEAQGTIPVGLEPVSVAFHRFQNSSGTFRNLLYTANWLGDSVTIVELYSSSNSLTYKMIGTFPVSTPMLDTGDLVQGDEPMCVAPLEFEAEGESPARDLILVTKRSRSSIAILSAYDASPVDPADGTADDAYRDLILTGRFSSGVASSLLNSTSLDPSFPDIFALKEPHAIAAAPDGSGDFVVLAHKGGGSEFHDLEDTASEAPPVWITGFDFDLWSSNIADVTTAARTPTSFGQAAFGTTNFNLTFDAEGGLYVVGTEARNEPVGNEALRDLSSGFVKSMLYRSKGGSIVELDLNAGAGTSGTAIAHPTDVAIYDPSGADLYAVVVGFNSDTIARIQVESSSGVLAPSNWVVTTDSVPHLATDESSPRMPEMAGPRGLAVDNATGRAYVLAAIDNSLVTYDLTGSAPSLTDQQPLAYDPLPSRVRLGRKFLYSTQGSGRPDASSTPGFVACASCHVDGRADHLAWRLTPEEDIDMPNDASESPNDFAKVSAAGDFLGPQLGFEFDFDFAPAFFLPTSETDFYSFFLVMIGSAGAFTDPELGGFPDSGGLEEPADVFANAKGIMVTQSLQGLANFEVQADGLLVHRFTNAPYHWRGDKPTFLTFNEAFVQLQGRDEELDQEDMELYEEFINSIHYPPNNAELLTREYSGDSEEGAQLGLDLFHTQAIGILGDRSCVHCHLLPVGTDNRWTTAEITRDASNPVDLNTQPLNSAALRGLVHKERTLEVSPGAGSDNISVITGNFGFGHDGQRFRSINDFVRSVAQLLDSDGAGPDVDQATPITAYLREFDQGVAPIVGRSVTVFQADVDVSGNITTAAKDELVDKMEEQAFEANAAVVAQWFDDDGTSDGNANDIELKRGYWFEIGRSGGARYKRESTTTALTRNNMLQTHLSLGLNGDKVVFTAVPLGSERRIASMTGQPTTPSSTSATSLEQIGTTSNTANAPVVGLTTNAVVSWSQTDGTNSFLKPTTILTFERFQEVLEDESILVAGSHDAPRRLQFVGSGLDEGGVVRLGISTSTSAPTTSDTFEFIDFPIFPTNQFANGGSTEADRIWETFVEIEPNYLYMLLVGATNPQIGEVLDGDADSDLGTFSGADDPSNWNLYLLEYRSPSGSVFTVSGLVSLVY